ncbi:MAG TPA: EI24 domain-containing protein [Phnomibacter sp.]|nr:EI24 domain-containing protein [Phnomibacter sp.]
MLKEIIIAIAAYGKAHSVIKQHRLWKWIILPGLLYMVLFLGGFYMLMLGIRSSVSERLFNLLGVDTWLERTDSTLLHFVFSFTGVVLWLLVALFYFSIIKYLWLIIGSPVFAWLSEKIENLVSGNTYEFSYAQWKRDMSRGVRLAMRNALWQSVYFVALLLLSIVPVVGWAVPFFALLIEAYYFGFSMLDYSFERRNTDAGTSIRFIGAHKGLAIGNGLVFYMLHLVPFVGWIFAPAYAVVAATLTILAPRRPIVFIHPKEGEQLPLPFEPQEP